MAILDKLKGKEVKKSSGNKSKDAIQSAYKKALSKKRWEEAIKSLEKLISLEPENESLKLKLGELLVNAKRNEEAIKHYQDICKAYEDEGHYRKAKATVNIILRMDPANEETQKMALGIEARLGFYRHPLFAELSEGEFGEIIKNASFRKYPKETIVIREGEPGESLYMICSGNVDVYKKDKKKGIAQLVAKIGKDNFVGEGGFLTGETRSATLVTTEETTMLELSKTAIETTLEKNPKIAQTIEQYHQKRQSTKG